MTTTDATAETAEEIPSFVEKFSDCADLSAYCAALKEQGFTHYMNIKPNRVTIGRIDGEYRVLVAVAFSKGEPPAFEELKAGMAAAEIPFLEQRKFYAMMSSIGRGDFTATLTASEVEEWIGFYEAEAGTIREIDDLI